MNKNLKLDIYQYSTDILTSQGRFYISLGLERVQAILELMQNPEKKLKFIHVAGTKQFHSSFGKDCFGGSFLSHSALDLYSNDAKGLVDGLPFPVY